ncbi:MAG TPA: hypothetical protein VMY37_22355 [Thermoguttaceae bacterium]|nr:hypothetical protein [Thermoguttaceae bacterium]
MSQDESNRELTGRRPEDELPPDLKAVEDELASLRPRDDRLDRERLAFLAGQASVGGRSAERGAAAARWAWPGACAGMTAVAATLLVALLVRPEPQVVERVRIVRVPVPAQVDEVPRSDADPRVADVLPNPWRPASPSRVEPRDSASRRPGPPAQADWSRFGSRREYLETIDRMLARGKDRWSQPAAVSGGGDQRPEAPTSDAPPPYREWLRTMLDDQARVDRPNARTTGPNRAGANS